jgi:hypothetical protein
MLKLTAKNYKSADADTRSRRTWPKYKTQLLNIACQNAKAFDANRVGSMKELWLEFVDTGVPDTLENWETFYTNRWGVTGLAEAGSKLKEMVDKMELGDIDLDMCNDYIKEVVFNKTHFGMGGESTAIIVTAEHFNLPYRFSNAIEESQGIDGFIGEYPVQVKPADSNYKAHVRNHADVDKTLVIRYEKKKQVCFVENPEFIGD